MQIKVIKTLCIFLFNKRLKSFILNKIKNTLYGN